MTDDLKPAAVSRRRNLPAVSKRARGLFLEALAAGWSIKHAAERAGVLRQRAYELRTRDEAFSAAWDEAVQAGTEALEDEARRRAVDGWDEPVYQRGELVGHVRRYDSRLLEFLLRARDPARFRDNAIVKVTGHDGGPVQIEGYAPPTLADVFRLAGELGVLDTIEGEAVEDAPLELEAPE